jgi:hypothetical protein
VLKADRPDAPALRAQASYAGTAIVYVAIIVGVGIFRPLHRERGGGGVFGGRKPIARVAAIPAYFYTIRQP